MSVLESVSKAYIRIENGIIAEVGSMKDLDTHADVTINAENGMVLPSWCDSHTHIVYAGTREQEFIFRIKGMSYEEIAVTMDCPIGTVRSRIFRAREAIDKVLKPLL